MSTDHAAPAADTPTTGTVRLHRDELPRNHHGDPVAPLTPDGHPYRLCWTDVDRGEMVFAETAEDLLAVWIPGYAEADQPARALLRAKHAADLADGLAARLVVEAEESGTPLSAEQEAIVLADLDKIPDIARWDSPVPLVLLEGMYRPFTDRYAPISGIDGDVREPCNIIWLRHAYPEEYVASLARAGMVVLDVHD